MMRTLKFYFVFMALLVISCNKDDTSTTKDLATPSLTWLTTNVIEDKLEISISVSSTDKLPSGNIQLLKDGFVIYNFVPTKGTHTYLTNFSFNDTEEHVAEISYSFYDGRPSIKKPIKLKMVESQKIKMSTKDDWTDL